MLIMGKQRSPHNDEIDRFEYEYGHQAMFKLATVWKKSSEQSNQQMSGWKKVNLIIILLTKCERVCACVLVWLGLHLSMHRQLCHNKRPADYGCEREANNRAGARRAQNNGGTHKAAFTSSLSSRWPQPNGIIINIIKQ